MQCSQAMVSTKHVLECVIAGGALPETQTHRHPIEWLQYDKYLQRLPVQTEKNCTFWTLKNLSKSRWDINTKTHLRRVEDAISIISLKWIMVKKPKKNKACSVLYDHAETTHVNLLSIQSQTVQGVIEFGKFLKYLKSSRQMLSILKS